MLGLVTVDGYISGGINNSTDNSWFGPFRFEHVFVLADGAAKVGDILRELGIELGGVDHANGDNEILGSLPDGIGKDVLQSLWTLHVRLLRLLAGRFDENSKFQYGYKKLK